MEKITNKLIEKLNIQFEDIFIEGLKRKGFVFSNKIELQKFVSENCKCYDQVHDKQKIYHVNDVPFLVHNYEVNFKHDYANNNNSISANYGTFKYL